MRKNLIPTVGVSLAAVLAVGAHAQCIAPPSDLVSWWTGDGTAGDFWDGNDGALMNGAAFGGGVDGQAFSFD
ncbi:MAG: hypothetical protein ABII00_14135, partial [Elusimicrobiota bacterium]